MSSHAPAGKVHVYEAANHARQESLMALVPDGTDEFRARLDPRPAPIAHWKDGEELVVEQIAEDMPVADAEEFLAFFLESVKERGWKLIVWRG